MLRNGYELLARPDFSKNKGSLPGTNSQGARYRKKNLLRLSILLRSHPYTLWKIPRRPFTNQIPFRFFFVGGCLRGSLGYLPRAMLPLNLTGASRTNRPDPLSLAIYGLDGGWFCPKMVIAHKDGASHLASLPKQKQVCHCFTDSVSAYHRRGSFHKHVHQNHWFS